MLIREIIPFGQGKKRYRIRLEDAEDIVLYSSEVKRLGFSQGDDITREEYERILNEILLPRAKKRAMHLLERQDRTREGLLSKLTSSGYPKDVAEKALKYVESYNYINDERYAYNYISCYQRERSRLRIRNDLLAKGIHADLVASVIEESYTESETEQIIRLMEKRAYDPSTATQKEKDRIYRFLAGKGYKTSDILCMI